MEIKVVKQILGNNEVVNTQIKRETAKQNVYIINVMGSPGAGKTSTLKQIIDRMRDKYRIGVIEGDVAGQVDAETIQAMGIPAVQLQTDGACHIEAASVKEILTMFDLQNLDVIFVENIGNLVCPSEFNIGEDLKVVILSVPEGDDKVIKYPPMFEVAGGVIINKYDMAPYFDFDIDRVAKDADDLNPGIEIFKISAKTGDGMDELCGWLGTKIDSKIRK